MTNIRNSMTPEQITLLANELLNNKQKVNLGQDDLQMLWEFTKQEKSFALLHPTTQWFSHKEILMIIMNYGLVYDSENGRFVSTIFCENLYE